MTQEELDKKAAEEAEKADEIEIDLDEEKEYSKDEIKAIVASKNRLFERAKKAEGFEKQADGTWIKKAESKPAEQKPAKKEITNTSKEETLTRDEIRLVNEGYDDDFIDKIKKFAKATGISVAEAMKDDLIVAMKEKKDADIKKAKASMGASKGSGSGKVEKPIGSLSRSEHEAKVKEIFGSN